ncbi:MAG: MarR family transcriptional regulator [Actinomycetota bacterium]|jgi:DNA-binding MarR family transcriptional regulator|nr:MarR family transcriptional regulator [Actinomycetota bacterium]
MSTETSAEPRWLDEQEMAAWLPLVRLLGLLPQALDRQLREDAGISHVYYQILAMLSDAPAQQMRMSELARLSATSLSRLSHAVASLEERGWVERSPSPEDRRGQLARLTDSGRQVLVDVAPGHVAEVRRLVFDRLTREQVAQLTALTTTVLAGLMDADGAGRRR